jgi:hypothetical protein
METTDGMRRTHAAARGGGRTVCPVHGCRQGWRPRARINDTSGRGKLPSKIEKYLNWPMRALSSCSMLWPHADGA